MRMRGDIIFHHLVHHGQINCLKNQYFDISTENIVLGNITGKTNGSNSISINYNMETKYKLEIMIAEEILFKDWIDESCGNFVGWTKDFPGYTLTINRENDGLYHFAIMKCGYRSSFNYDKYLISEKKLVSLFEIDQWLIYGSKVFNR